MTQNQINEIIKFEKTYTASLKQDYPNINFGYYPNGIVELVAIDNCNLKELPSELKHFMFIEGLFAYNNNLELLPSWLSERDSLRTLAIGGNNFDKIPEVIEKCCQLEYLSLSRTKISTFKLNCKFSNLEELGLDNTLLSEFPIILQTENSPPITLHLKNTLIKTIPKEVETMRIKQLLMTDNQLEYIAPEIGLLEDLEWLYLTNSPNLPLDALPKELGNCNNLQVISFDNCNLTEFPTQLTEIENLINLSLNDNNIKEVPAEISKLQNMSTFYIRNNQLTTLPKQLNKMPGLHFLDLRYNNIESLPAKMFDIKRDTLCSIILEGNPIKSMPVSKEEFSKGYKHL